MNVRKIGLGLAIAAGVFIAQVSMAGAAQLTNEFDGAAYCVKKGGVVQTRVPAYDTNGGDPLILAGKREFCQFTSQKDGSQINILLGTLATRNPSLAALAYYAEVQMGSCNGNPASCYCTLLGGSDLFGGVSGAGGGWVLDSDHNDVLEACIFPDMSSVDSWGLAYHSEGVIRGKDLAKVLRYGNPYSARHEVVLRGRLPF
jgi:hypothetical protein